MQLIDPIQQHDFNTRWLGKPCGISSSAGMLELSAAELSELCRPYAFVELRLPAPTAATDRLLPTNGLVQVDTQLSYRLPVARVGASPAGVRATRFPDLSMDTSWPQHMAAFGVERYGRLSLVDVELLQRRYTLWASELVERNPAWCLRIDSEAGTEGFAFATPNLGGTRLTLDLVAGSKQSSLPGLAVFLCAVNTYRNLGVRSISSSFSAHNIGAVNAHIALGCRVMASTDIWFYEP